MQNKRRAALLIAVANVAAVSCHAPTPKDTSSTTCAISGDMQGHFVEVPNGSFVKGDKPIYADEGPTIRLQVDGFAIQIHEVTNDQFAAFVEATGYITDSEQGVIDQRDDAGSAVFIPAHRRAPTASPWALVQGATWKSPDGPGSSIEGRGAYPVVHVSQRDASAYAAWANGRLPSEVEWEYAASLGLPDPDNPTSGAYDDTSPRANTWQGIFPIANTGADGFQNASPAGCFAADRLGLYDMIGNVWELTNTSYGTGTHTMKGGSYLCADNFCRRYRPAARHPQDTDFSSSHVGFRIVRDIDPDKSSAP